MKLFLMKHSQPIEIMWEGKGHTLTKQTHLQELELLCQGEKLCHSSVENVPTSLDAVSGFSCVCTCSGPVVVEVISLSFTMNQNEVESKSNIGYNMVTLHWNKYLFL